MQNIYSVTITSPTGAAPSAPNDGFIDATTISQYMALNDAGPTTLANSLAKTRANYRYKLLCQQMSINGNTYTANMVAVGADCNTPASSFTFNACVEHGADSLYVYDETNNYALLTGIPALVRTIARALIASETTELMFLDPTATTAPGNSEAYQRVGFRLATETVGPVSSNLTAAAALITVTQIV